MKRKLSLAILLLVVLSLGLLAPWKHREPQYDGRKLSEWLGDLDYGLPKFNPAAAAKAQEAVRQIGPRGVPTLIGMIRYREPFWRPPLNRLLARQNVFKFSLPLSEEHVQWRGARGIWIVGTNAGAAVPYLVPLLTNRSSWIRGGAAMALGETGTNSLLALPLLIKALDDPVPDVRNCTAIAIQKIGPGAHDAIASLIRHFDDPNIQTRSLAISAFLSVTNQKSRVIPFLMRQLDDPVPEGRSTAAITLGSFGPEAEGAMPALRTLLRDPDRAVRRSATTAVLRLEGKRSFTPSTSNLSFTLKGVELDRVLEFYSQMKGVKVDRDPEIRFGRVEITIDSQGPIAREEALRLIETELQEQARVVLIPSSNGVVRARYQTAP